MRVAGVGKGLYVKRDCVIDLAGVYAGRLPRAVGSVQVRTRWMRDVCEARVERYVSFHCPACDVCVYMWSD